MAEKELSQYPAIGQIGSGTRLAVIESGRNAQAPAGVLGDFVGVQIEASGLPSDVEALKAGQQTSSIYKATLAELQATAGSYVGQGGFVPGVGQFSWNGTEWRLIAQDVLADKADKAVVAGVAAVAEAVDSRTQAIEPARGATASGAQVNFALADSAGNAIFVIGADNLVRALGLAGPGFAADMATETDWSFAWTDGDGNVIAGIKDGRWYPEGASGEALDRLDLRNRSFSSSIAAAGMRGVQQPTADFNLVVNYGQSLAEGNETWPSLSKVTTPGTLMLGENVDQTALGGSYTPIGSGTLQQLVARTRVGSANITDAQEAALAAGDQAIGEPPVIAAASTLKADMNRRLVAQDDGRKVVALNPAVGGRTIEQLSKGASDNAYGLVTDGLAKASVQAGAGTKCVPLVMFAQGEYNYADVNATGPTTDRAPYAALMRSLLDNLATDAQAATGQSLPPLVLTYQTGASWTRDASATGAVGLSIGMAQLDVALTRAATAMIGPVYQYPDKGGHLDSNGSRWFGCMFAKVARKILLEGQGWQPVRPLQVERDGSTLLIHYHVPVPPLRFASPIVGATLAVYADRGFRVTSADGATDYPVTSVEVVRGTIIRLTLGVEPPASALLWYGDKNVHNGNGMVCDSDREVAAYDYEYVPARGMYAIANIPSFVGKPYPLQNWSVAFCVPLTYSEI